jgi:hypothetical protein
MSWTLHTGCMGDRTDITVDWFDENMVGKRNDVCVRILNQDKPRVLVIEVDGHIVWQSPTRRPDTQLGKYCHSCERLLVSGATFLGDSSICVDCSH